MLKALRQALGYGWRYLCSRKIYFVCCTVVPMLFAFFFIDLMKEGLPLKVPVSVVDLDRSSLSRRVVRNLGSTELIDVAHSDENFNQALDRVRKGETFGFFIIPRDFQRNAISGQGTTITYYSDLTVFVPGSLAYKGFKTVAVTTAGGVVQTTLTTAGVNEQVAGTLLQPVVIGEQPVGNPWLNYSIYLCNSFIPGVIALMVMLLACYTICDEIKKGTSPEWIRISGGSVLVAVVGKLLPQTLVFSAIGVFLQAVMYRFCGFPLHCSPWNMVFAMILLVIGSQGLALTICCVIPNLRLSLSMTSLVGILSFSIAAYSFPVQSMYGAIGIFSYILPARYYFLIYADQALNGIPLYYSRLYYIALLIFPLVGMAGLPRLKKHCLNPVYVP
ncbi:MAG: ABC transporter permease [Paramuribaculum sp.]|nr:ABC transporter permease [Paramuribaculum sp.]